jgi:transcriptional/translational regulatory protein YebC/TACO1
VGSVAWQFEQKGFISVPKGSIDEESLMEVALEAGAQDIKNEEDSYDIITEPAEFEAVKKALEAKSIKPATAEVTMVPKTYVKLTGKSAESMLKLMDALEENEDVSNVYANFDISKEEMDRIESQP